VYPKCNGPVFYKKFAGSIDPVFYGMGVGIRGGFSG
jgi:hypothetical protein